MKKISNQDIIKIAVIALILSAAPASAETANNSGIWIGPTNITPCLSTAPDDCVKSDLVVTSGNKTILLHGIYGCKAIAGKLNGTPDVVHAECFL
jgi:hypothetical protein